MKMRGMPFVANITRVVNRTNQSDCVRKEEPCMDPTPLIACLCLVCIVGVVSNVLLLYSDYKEWKKRKTPDKVLICNITVTNLIALLISLPFRAVQLSQASERALCNRRAGGDLTVQKVSMVICTLVSLATLGVLGVDRLDALTKFPHQRKLTVKKAIVASILVWLCSLLTLPLSMFQTNMPLIMLIWICISCALIVSSLLLATRRIRKHRQKIVQMFGARDARAEIKFTKNVVALCFCNAVFMLPHLIAFLRDLLNPYFMRNRTFKCALSLSTNVTYLSFTLLPVAYFAMDLRMLSLVLPKLAALSTRNYKVSTTDNKETDQSATGTTGTNNSSQIKYDRDRNLVVSGLAWQEKS